VANPLRVLGRFTVRFRWPIVIAWVAGTYLAIHFLPTIAEVEQNNNATFLPSNTPSIQASELQEPFAPTDLATATLVAYNSAGKLSSEDGAAIQRAEDNVRKVDKVVKVINLGPSQNQRATQSLVELDVSPFGDPEADDAVDAIRDTFDKSLEGTKDLHLYLTGGVATNVDTNKQQATSQELTETFSALLILVLLFITYRSFLAPIVNIVPAALALGLADAVVAESSKIGVAVSSVTQAMLTVLILGAGTDYGLFLILRMREELRNGRNPKEAVVEAMAQVGESITFAALTVVGALLCLLLATFSLYSGLGPGLAIGIGIMAAAALTLLPVLLAIFGHALFWPKRWGEPSGEKRGAWERVGDHVIKHPVATLIGGVALFGGLTLGVIGVGNAGFGSVGGGPAGSDSAAGAEVVAQNFPASSINPTSVLMRFSKPVWDDLGTIETAQQELARAGPFATVTGPFNPNGVKVSEKQLVDLHSALGPPQKLPVTPPSGTTVPKEAYAVYRAEGQYVSLDGKTVQFQTSLTAGDPGSTKALNAVPEMREAATKIADEAGAVDSGVSGIAPVSYDVNKIANDDLVTILPIVLAVIAILLALLVRSLVAPVYLILSVLLSYGAALGLACIIFVHIGGAAGVNFVLPFLLFIFLMALGEDYNILMMARIHEEATERPLSQAIHRSLHLTGTTITSAGVILAGTFAVSGILGSTSQLRQIGWAIALGVLMDTFLVRTLLVPSTALLLGRWNWWPSRLGRKVA
jgi:RND superfamily putative drug exporter